MIDNVIDIKPVEDQEYSQYFVNLTKNYLKNPGSDLQFQKELEFFINYSKRFGKGPDLLEIGCGTGRTLIFLAKEGFNCQGVDFDPTQIKYALQTKEELGIKNINYSVAIIDSEEKFEKKYDIIISNDLVEHLPDNELLKYFNQAYNALNEDGIFLIHSKPLRYTYLLKKKFVLFILIFFYLPEKLFNLYLKKLDFIIPRIYKALTKKNLQNTWQDLPPGHCNPPDDENIREQLESRGFNVEEIKLSHPGTHKLSGYFRKILKSKKLNSSIFIFCTKNQITPVLNYISESYKKF